ncbi:unnamed protein product [Meganyctiphanes norvegica]|uniref:Uncharacterized protein n=1 Tax=Meganyctiphanes norvegica TaxID=48144 RepID=A0AAV2PZY4_MEGNR
MSKIPKLPKGQSRPASPEPSPNSLNDNNTTPNMQVLQPRSSSLSRSSSLRRSFIRPPKARGMSPSRTPPQKSSSPPPSSIGSPPAKGLPPSGMTAPAAVTPPRTGLPPRGIPSAITPPTSRLLPPSGLVTPGSVSKGDSPNTKMSSSYPNDTESKLSSPKTSLSHSSSFSRNSPLRSSRIPRGPRKTSLPPQLNTSIDPESADSVSSDQSDNLSSSPGDSRNSSPTPSSISKIPTVKGSAVQPTSRRFEVLKNRRLKYPALWNLGAPNYFSEQDDMEGNTSLEMLRLGVEELETRVTSLECQMGIQNTELLYNSDDEDKSPQDPEEAYLHELTDPTRTSTQTLTSLLGSYSYLKPPLHTSPSTSMSNLRSPTTSMSNLRSPTSSLTNLRKASGSLSSLGSPEGSMSNLRCPSTSMVSLLKRPESPCRSHSLTQSPEKSYSYNDTPYKSNQGGMKALSFQRFLSPWADYSEQIDKILNFRKVH